MKLGRLKKKLGEVAFLKDHAVELNRAVRDPKFNPIGNRAGRRSAKRHLLHVALVGKGVRKA